MTDERTLSDDDIRTVTTGSSTIAAEERPGDTDGTDTQDTDGTDSQDQDGKDSKDADGTDQ